MNRHESTSSHPGEVLREDFLIPLGLSEYRVAKDIGVPPRRINEIVKGTRSITVDTALRLERSFRWQAEVWLNLQAHHDQQVARDLIRAELEGIRPCPALQFLDQPTANGSSRPGFIPGHL